MTVESTPAKSKATAVTAKAPADYTIALLTTAHVITPAIYKSLEFDPVNDFEFILTVSDLPFCDNSPHKTIGDAAWYKQAPTRFVGFNLRLEKSGESRWPMHPAMFIH